MAGKYRIKIYDHTATLVAVLDSYSSLNYTKLLNDKGSGTITLDSSVPIEYLSADMIWSVERSETEYGIDWYEDFGGFARTQQHDTASNDRQYHTVYLRSFEDLLARRAIAWKAGSVGANLVNMPVETAIKTYVILNCGEIALQGFGRAIDGVIPGFVVSADGARGPLYTGSNPWRGVLDVIKDIANNNSFAFFVLRNGTTFTFICEPLVGGLINSYTPYCTDRTEGSSEPAIFSQEAGNMVSPTYSLSRIEEINRVIVLGQGEDAAREVLVVQDTLEQSSSPWNVMEKTHDARNSATTDSLQVEGDQELVSGKAKESFSFQVLQSDALRYGRDYFFGDLVTARMHGIQRNKRIVGVTVSQSEGKEQIQFQFSDVAQNPDPLIQILENISKNMKRIETRQNL